MGLGVAIQMDPIEHIDINGDSSFAMALEAKRRGHTLYHYQPKDLSFQDRKVMARVRALDVRREAGNHFTLGAPELIDLSEMDVVLMRQDPPFDMSYITATHILEHIHPKTLVVNDPVEVRNAPEKLFVTHFDNVMPPTLITHDRERIQAFRAEHEDIIVQRYLPEVRQGDKRIILIDGKPVGAINRVPAAGEARSNMHVGGRAEKIGLTKRDAEICEIIGPTLAEKGLIFVGIDVIGDYLTEINVTSPTGLQELGRFDGRSIEAELWDAIESKR